MDLSRHTVTQRISFDADEQSRPRNDGFIPPHGGYAGLLAYQKATIVFQATVHFCQRFLKRTDRTIDQMVQAARDTSYETYATYIEAKPPEVVANILICLIHQTNYLLDQLLRKLEKDFLKEGGLRECMTRARLATRAKQNR